MLINRKGKNMKKILNISMAMLVGMFLLTGCQNNKDVKPIETKANTNTEVVKDQQLENFTFKSTSLVYEEQTSTLQTVVTNTGSKVEMLSEFLIHVKDAEGNEIVTLTGFIGDSLKPGESRTITSSYGDDLTTAASISYEIVR